MKKTQRLCVVITVLLIVIMGLYLNVVIQRNNIKKYTEDYIVSLGYPIESISNIEINHSYLNRVLSFNEWRIAVTFEKKPDISFWLTYKNNEIISQGVSQEPMLDKEQVFEYSEKFHNGTLLDD